MHDLLLLSAAACYLLAAFLLYRGLLSNADARPLAPAMLSAAGVVLHGTAQAQHWLFTTPVEVSFLNVLSLCALVIVLLVLFAAVNPNRLFAAGLIALPLAAIMLLAEWAIDAPGNILGDVTPAVGAHVVSSVMAFGFLALAGVYAIFVTVIDQALRRHALSPMVRALPALDVLETLLFTLVGLGFALLTVSLLTGFLFVDNLFDQSLVHKTVLSIAAWLLFGALLGGRLFWGWRGRTAVRLTIGGVLVLMLAYFGSKFILEAVLGRSWG